MIRPHYHSTSRSAHLRPAPPSGHEFRRLRVRVTPPPAHAATLRYAEGADLLVIVTVGGSRLT